MGDRKVIAGTVHQLHTCSACGEKLWLNIVEFKKDGTLPRDREPRCDHCSWNCGGVRVHVGNRHPATPRSEHGYHGSRSTAEW